MPGGTPLDRIMIRDLKVFAYHGVLPEEKERGQEFLIDIDLDVDSGPAASHDDLGRTVDYASVVKEVAEIATAGRRNIVEAVAYAIADHLLTLEGVARARVTVKKPAAPLEVEVGWVGFQVTRTPGAPSERGGPP